MAKKEPMNVHSVTIGVSRVIHHLEEQGFNEGEQFTILQAAGVLLQSHITSKTILLNMSKILAS